MGFKLLYVRVSFFHTSPGQGPPLIHWLAGMCGVDEVLRRPFCLFPFSSFGLISKSRAKNIRLFKIVSVFAEGDSNFDKMWHFWHLGKIMISKVHLLAGYCYSWHFTFTHARGETYFIDNFFFFQVIWYLGYTINVQSLLHTYFYWKWNSCKSHNWNSSL